MKSNFGPDRADGGDEEDQEPEADDTATDITAGDETPEDSDLTTSPEASAGTSPSAESELSPKADASTVDRDASGSDSFSGLPEPFDNEGADEVPVEEDGEPVSTDDSLSGAFGDEGEEDATVEASFEPGQLEEIVGEEVDNGETFDGSQDELPVEEASAQKPQGGPEPSQQVDGEAASGDFELPPPGSSR
ncbi:MAG: hypothetical protein ABEN55_14520, partial [Bradymonadaceae bacterium]